MTEIPVDSALWTTARLGPYVLTRFNVQEAEVAPDARVEVFVDAIALWQRPRSTFARSIEASRDFLKTVVAAYAVRTGVALDFTFSGWIEATDADFTGTVIGVAVDQGHRDSRRRRLDPNAQRNVDMAAAIELAAAVQHRGGWRLAVRDVYAAHRALLDESDDCFVFAYRAIEDLAHAVSTGNRKSWPQLQAHLGTDERGLRRRTDPLMRARNAAAHGDESDPDLVAARANRALPVRRSRRIVRDAIAAAPFLPNT